MSQADEPTEIARRLAFVLSAAMNFSALLANEAALAASDPAELRSALVSLVDELRWMQSLAGIHGISWPADADARIARLDSEVTAWAPGEPVPQEVIASAGSVLEMLGVVRKSC